MANSAGSRLKEEESAEAYAVSRGPVREAFRILERRGFVEIVPRHGARVRAFDPADLASLFSVRAVLFGLAARQATERATERRSSELVSQLAEQVARLCRSAEATRDGDGPGHPEVGHHRLVAIDQDVLGLDVAVDHAVGMGVPSALRHLADDLHRLVERQLALARQSLPERFAFHVRHRVPQPAAASPESCTGRMWGCCRRAAILISWRNRSGPSEANSSPRSTLRATGRSCRRSCASHTVAIPPRPSSRSMR